jgi:hypothetical protein
MRRFSLVVLQQSIIQPHCKETQKKGGWMYANEQSTIIHLFSPRKHSFLEAFCLCWYSALSRFQSLWDVEKWKLWWIIHSLLFVMPTSSCVKASYRYGTMYINGLGFAQGTR